MAAAENIHYSSSVQSPCVIIPLMETMAQENLEAQNHASSARTAKGLYTTTAPQLSPSSSGGYLNMLDEYMQMILLAMVKMAQQAGDVSQLQTSVANNQVTLSQKLAQTAADNLKKQVEAEERASHQSWIHKIVSDVVSGLMIVAGAVTGDPVLMMMGAVMLTMSLTNGSTDLNSFLSKFPAGARFGIECGIALACGMALTGGAALFEMAAESAASEAAGAAAEQGVADGAADASEVGSQAGDADDIAANGAEESTTSEGMSTTGKVLANATMVTPLINPFTDLILLIEEGYNGTIGKATGKKISKSRMEISSEIVGTVMAMIASLKAASTLSQGESGQTLFQKATNMSDQALNRVQIALRLATSGANGLAGYYMFEQGKATEALAPIFRQMGQTENKITVNNNSFQMTNRQIQENQAAAQQVNAVFEDMTSEFINYVNQYRTAAQIMG